MLATSGQSLPVLSSESLTWVPVTGYSSRDRYLATCTLKWKINIHLKCSCLLAYSTYGAFLLQNLMNPLLDHDFQHCKGQIKVFWEIWNTGIIDLKFLGDILKNSRTLCLHVPQQFSKSPFIWQNLQIPWIFVSCEIVFLWAAPHPPPPLHYLFQYQDGQKLKNTYWAS